MTAESKSCFVISPIGDVDSPERIRSDEVLKYVIKPAVISKGYAEPVRADAISEPGLITTQIIDRIREDDLVVADLTGGNPNVYYELSIRHAIKKPVVLIIAAGENPHFDVAGMRAIPLDHKSLTSAAECRHDIGEQIDAIHSHGAGLESPISVAVNLADMRESDGTGGLTLAGVEAAVYQGLSGVKAEMRALRKEANEIQIIQPGPFVRDDDRAWIETKMGRVYLDLDLTPSKDDQET